jgi:hypothetical protein
MMIYKDDKVTAWQDTAENLVKATHEAAFSDRKIDIVRSDKHGVIRKIRDSWIAGDAAIRDTALALGYWVEPVEWAGGWEIHFAWKQDAAKPPNDRAIHA